MTSPASASVSQGPQRSGKGLTAKEAADYCGVKLTTLAKWRHQGIGPRYSARLGRDPRYHQADLDEFLWGDRLVSNSVEARLSREGRRRER